MIRDDGLVRDSVLARAFEGTKLVPMNELLATLPLWFAIFLFSTVCHEAAHALAARWGGDDTAHQGGQTSLDPIPHLRRHPLGMVIVPIASFLFNGGSWMIGWASAPYDPIWASRYPKRAGWMALAGPLANLSLAVLCGIVIMAGLGAGLFRPPVRVGFDELVVLSNGATNIGTLALSVGFTLNLLLFTFNLIPLPPLDGSAVLGLLLPPSQYRKWNELISEPTYALVGMIIAFQGFKYIWVPVFRFATRVLYAWV